MRILKAINELALYWRLNIEVYFWGDRGCYSGIRVSAHAEDVLIGMHLNIDSDHRRFLHELDDACRQVTAGYINHILKDWKPC